MDNDNRKFMTKEFHKTNMETPLFNREDPEVKEAIEILLRNLRAQNQNATEDDAWEVYLELRRKNEPHNQQLWSKLGSPGTPGPDN